MSFLTDILLWSASNTTDHLLYSFDVSQVPQRRTRIVGCSVGGHDLPVERVITALEQSSRLGRPNDNQAPSIIARNAGWFFVRDRQPNWVSVMKLGTGNEKMVVVGISTHQRRGR